MDIIKSLIKEQKDKGLKINDKEIEKTFNLLDSMLVRSYSKYSGFKVACVLVFKDGSMVGGCNVENASYSHTICAERCAIFSAIAQGKNVSDIEKIYITSNSDKFFYPCGACRQVFSEFLNPKILCVVMKKEKDKFSAYKLFDISELLPFSFNLN